MISKNKNLFLKIYIPFVIIISIALIVLQILGSKKRVGYLTDFDLEIYRTLELNNLNDIREEFTIDGKLDEEYVINYLLTNENITNYVHHFRIRYYDKTFRNNDIYGVYPDLSNLPDYIKNVEMDGDGSPYGNFISDKKEISEEKIDNINYVLKIKFKFLCILYLLCIFIIAFIIAIRTIIYYIKKYTIKSHLKFLNNILNIIKSIRLLSFLDEYSKYRNKFIRLYNFVLLFTTFIIIIFSLLGNRYYSGKLSDFQVIMKSKAGIVYRANIIPNSYIFRANFIYRYSDKPLKLKHKPDYIKNYGYALEINRAPDWYNSDSGGFTWNNNDGSFTVSNSIYWNWFGYEYRLTLSKGEIYRIISEMKRTINIGKRSDDNNTFINLDDYNNKIGLYPTNNKIIFYTNSSQYLLYSNQIEIYDLPYNRNNVLSFNFPSHELNIKYILISQISDNLYIKNNEFIVFTSYSDNIQNQNISNIYYKLKLNNHIYLFYIILLIPILIYKTKNIIISNLAFIIIAFISVLFLAVFHYWLCYPGIFFNWDMWRIYGEAISGRFTNGNPVIFSYILYILYNLFGYHTHYLFLINIILFYLGLFIIIISLYYKFRNKYIIFLILISLIPYFFFLIINHLKDYVAILNIWLSFSIIFCLCLVNIKNKIISLLLKFLSILFLLIGMLSRHNFIVLVYPMFIFFAYNILEKYGVKNKLKYLITFIFIMVIFAFGLIFIYKMFPRAIIGKDILAMDTKAIQLLQISALAVRNNDNSLIPEEWYKYRKDFEDLKIIYSSNPYNSDIFVFIDKDKNPFINNSQIKNVNNILIKYILKYPFTYIKYLYEIGMQYFKIFNMDKVNVYYTQYHLFKHYELISYFDNSGINFTDNKAKIYSNLYRFIPEIPFYCFILLYFIVFIISGILWLLKPIYRTKLLLFTLCVCLCALSTNIILIIYSPIPLFRYIYPIMPLSVLSLISFITFIYDIGGVKKIIKELK
ncbi:hypothetical protein [Brachyspira aalborgi]|uniref:hypothetical protein n=1 Tax=Brachyspira aalborgi TaxID=29522 RepID=UPI0026661203|nr:hypothetical protein [Brachyspira aalborgi]